MKGERLLDLRKDAGLSQDELSEIIHVNKHSISSYERNKSEPPDEIKIRIANYFGVSVDYLLGITDNPVPYVEAHNYIHLPLKLPDIVKVELEDFAQFLTNKYCKNKFS